MPQDFRQKDLRGQSFRGQDLSGADFSGADLRGTNFTNATLVGCQFSHSRSGLKSPWLLGLVVSGLAMVGLTYIGYGAVGFSTPTLGFYSGVWQVDPIAYRNVLINTLSQVLVLIILAVVAVQRGVSGLAPFSTAIAATVCSIAFWPGAGNFINTFIIFNLVSASSLIGMIVEATALALARVWSKKFGIGVATASAIIGSILGIILGFDSVFEAYPVKQWVKYLVWGITALITAGLFALSFYIGWRAIAGDRRYTVICKMAIALGTWGGTSFRGANLTDADFSGAVLKNTDLRRATLTRTNWFQVAGLDMARLGTSYLVNSQIRQLVTTKNGQNQNFDQLDLRGLNLENANLKEASLIGAKLSEATLRQADLSRAKLVQTQLYNSDLTGACLTGAIIQDWSISPDTKLESVQCRFVYMQLPTSTDPDPCRKPDRRDEEFKDGDFTDFIAPIIKTLDLYRTQNVDPRALAQTFKTLDLYHYEGIDPTAAAIALKQLATDHPEAALEVVALEGRGEDKIRLQAKVAGVADRSALSVEYFERYKEISSLPYPDLQALLAGMAEKDKRIRSLEKIVTAAIGSNKFYVETYYQMGDTVSEKGSINIQAGGDIGNVSGIVGGDVSGVLNLGTISGNVTNAINQLPATSDPGQPGLKELLTELQAAIEAEAALSNPDKAEALEQVKVLAEAGQKPEDSNLQKAAKTAMKILRGTIASLPDVTKLAEAAAKLLPMILPLLPFL